MNMVLYSQDNVLLERWQNALQPSRDYCRIEFCQSHKLLLKKTQQKRCMILYHLSVPYDKALDYQELTQQCEHPEHLFVLASHPNLEEAVNVLYSGAKGYANERLDDEILKVAVDCILDGEIWIEKEILHKLLAKSSDNDELQRLQLEQQKALQLSKREKQIVDKIVQGKTNAQTADELDISERTVKTHISNIYRKTNTKNRIDLINKYHS